jgi:hypothetical protein
MFTMAFFLFVAFASAASFGSKSLIGEGDTFPETPLEKPSEERDLQYFGISEKESFQINDINAELMLVEILNINCGSCQRQAPVYNKLYELIESNPEVQGRIKMAAVAVGNELQYVKEFRDHFKIPYPVLHDPHFKLYDAIGGSHTPFTMFVRRDVRSGLGIVVGTHMGYTADYKGLFQEMRAYLEMDMGEARKGKEEEEDVETFVEPILSEEELRLKARAAFVEDGGVLEDIREELLGDGERVYIGRITRNNRTEQLFAVAINRPVPCDICHDAHFMYVFDESGRIIKFIPIQLTKYGNESWDDEDVAKMRGLVVGRSLFEPFDYDAEVDGVSSATITSAVIFKTLNEGRALFDAIEAQRVGD